MNPIVSAAPKVPCVRCNKTHDTPAAFLIACCKCQRAWHHKCHIPPVEEAELLRRFEADEKGKRDAGLAAWQCRRCSKRLRIEPPSVTQAKPQERNRTSPAASVSRDVASMGGRVEETSRVDSVVSVGPSRKTVTPETRSRIPTSPTVIEVDEDIEIIDVTDSSVIVPSPKPTTIQTPVKPPDPAIPTKASTSTSAAPAANGLPPKPATIAVSFQGRGDVLGKATNAVGLRQKRPVKNTFVITPLVSFQRAVDEVRPPSPSRSHAVSGLPARPATPSARDVRAAAVSREPTPLPSSHVSPTATPASLSSQDLRELISSMRAKGQLGPPPVIDYVLSRPEGSRRTSTRATSAPKRGITDMRSQSRDLQEVEEKLSNLVDDSMDIDSSPLPEPVSRRDPDSHDIDDLYGEIAPRYRTAQHSPPRAKSAAPTQGHLLFALQKKRASSKDLPITAPPGVGEREESTRSRKAPARQLKGKILRRKQVAGLVFSVGETDWSASR